MTDRGDYPQQRNNSYLFQHFRLQFPGKHPLVAVWIRHVVYQKLHYVMAPQNPTDSALFLINYSTNDHSRIIKWHCHPCTQCNHKSVWSHLWFPNGETSSQMPSEQGCLSLSSTVSFKSTPSLKYPPTTYLITLSMHFQCTLTDLYTLCPTEQDWVLSTTALLNFSIDWQDKNWLHKTSL